MNKRCYKCNAIVPLEDNHCEVCGCKKWYWDESGEDQNVPDKNTGNFPW